MTLIFAASVLLMNLLLATQVSFALYVLAVVQVPLAMVLAIFASRKPGRWSVAMGLLVAGLLAPIPLLRLEPYFVNRLVAKVGPHQILADAQALCQEYEASEGWKEEGIKWNQINPSDTRLGSISRLRPIYAQVNATSVSLKMGGMIDMYWGITITPEGVNGSSVDWSQTWIWDRSKGRDGISRASRVIAPAIVWDEWSAP